MHLESDSMVLAVIRVRCCKQVTSFHVDMLPSNECNGGPFLT